MTDACLIPQTAVWYDRLATLREGYRYPWRSRIGRWHGQDAYLALVGQHLLPDADVLDVLIRIAAEPSILGMSHHLLYVGRKANERGRDEQD